MDVLIPLTFVVALLSSILSGMAGVGGGLIMQPFWLLIGLSPAQAAANASFLAFGIGGGSLTAFQKTKYLPGHKKLIIVLAVITVIASIIGALLLPYFEASSFKPALAILTILALPLLFINKKKLSSFKHSKRIGVILFSILVVAGSVTFSSTFWILIAIMLPTLFNLTILQSTVIRRIMGLVQAIIIFALLTISGNFAWTYAIAGIIGAFIGSYIGTRVAIAKGDVFARYALALMALVSAIALLI
ncbi:TSUP family transporter [soil metagenome]